MLIIGSADINRINIVTLDQLTPVSFMALKAPLFGEGFGAVFGAAANGFQYGAMLQVGKEVANTLITV